uniref:exodeoxyribonuclease III n=1 Tax=Macrostomum lignano TaxID=282301 RepID=A0A1I8F344_9PLAT
MSTDSTAFFAFCESRAATPPSTAPTGCRPLRAGDSLLGAGGPDDSVGSWPDGPGLSAAVGCDDDPAARVALDSEGRCLLIEFPTSDAPRRWCSLPSYWPRMPTRPTRLECSSKMRYHRLLAAEGDCLIRSGKHVIIAGDLNVSHRLIDHCETAEALPISGGDASRPAAAPTRTRCTSPSWPSRRTGARQTNYGNRIDYVLVSHSLADQLLDCDIQPEVSGSDHCPVLAVLSDGYPLSAPPDQPLPSLAAARLPEFAARQRRISDFLAPWRGAQQAPKPPAKQEPPPASLKKRKQPQQQPAAKRRQAS